MARRSARDLRRPRRPHADFCRFRRPGATIPVLRSADARSRRTAGGVMVDAPRQPHRPRDLRGRREIGRPTPGPPTSSSVSTSGRGSVGSGSRFQHDGESGVPSDRDRDDVAAPQRDERRDRGVPAVGAACRSSWRSRLLSPLAQARVLEELAVRAAELFARAAPAPPRCVRCRAIRPTTDRSAWNCANDRSSRARDFRGAHPIDQVDRHVVGRPERAAQREGAGGGQPGDRRRVRPRAATAPPRAPRCRCRGVPPGR